MTNSKPMQRSWHPRLNVKLVLQDLQVLASYSSTVRAQHVLITLFSLLALTDATSASQSTPKPSARHTLKSPEGRADQSREALCKNTYTV